MGVLANHHSSLQCITSVANFTYWWRTSICTRFPHRMTQPETDRFWRTMSVRESPSWNEAAEAESRVGSGSLALAQAMTSMQRDAAESEVSRRATRRPTYESAFRCGNKCITGLGSHSHTHHNEYRKTPLHRHACLLVPTSSSGVSDTYPGLAIQSNLLSSKTYVFTISIDSLEKKIHISTK